MRWIGSKDGSNARQTTPRIPAGSRALLLAARRDLRDVAELLHDLGMSPNVGDKTNFRPLHQAAANDSVAVGALLIARGAEIDTRETRFNGVPLGWASFRNSRRMMEMLGAVSRTPRELVSIGNTSRLRQLFAAEPELAILVDEDGSLFFDLPEDEDLALEVTVLLLASGADPHATDRHGTNAMEHAEKQGLDAAGECTVCGLNSCGACVSNVWARLSHWVRVCVVLFQTSRRHAMVMSNGRDRVA